MVVVIKRVNHYRAAQANGYEAGRRAIRMPEYVTEGSWAAAVDLLRVRTDEAGFYYAGFIEGMREQMLKIQQQLERTHTLERSGGKPLPHSNYVSRKDPQKGKK